MQVSNPRIHIDETYSLKVIDETDDWLRCFELVEQGVKNIGEESIDSEFLHEVAKDFATADKRMKIFLVLYKDLKPIGILLGMKVDTHPVFRKTGITIEQLWWIDPVYRGSKVATKLIEAFEEWSRQVGVKRMVMGHFNDLIGTKVKKYYERSGFKLLEQSYVKELISSDEVGIK